MTERRLETDGKFRDWATERQESERQEPGRRGNGKSRTAAIVLAAGSGKRMGTAVKKQYLLLDGKPILYYSLKEFEQSPVDEIVLVTASGEEEYCREEVVRKYGFDKISRIVAGGRERYHSVYEGLKALDAEEGVPDYVLIHDGARPFADGPVIRRAMEDVEQFGACVSGMPSKDTVKLADENGFARLTPDRTGVWTIQTPQAFSYSLIRGAYEKLMSREDYQRGITDDAMVVEHMTQHRVKLTMGSYENIKVTTPEDMEIALAILRRRQGT